MKESKLKETIITKLDDLQAKEITCIKTAKSNFLTDYIIICTSKSTTHATSLMNNILKINKKEFTITPRVEGNDFNEWILIDCGDIIIHIMLDQIRNYYQLEKLWDKELEE